MRIPIHFKLTRDVKKCCHGYCSDLCTLCRLTILRNLQLCHYGPKRALKVVSQSLLTLSVSVFFK